MSDDTYLTALRMLSRRELSEAQVRQRLTRKQHDPDAIEAAVSRLKSERSLDDARTAGAIARTEVSLGKRAKLGTRRRIESAGIAPAIAQNAVEEAFADVDADAFLTAAADKRLRGKTGPLDDGERRRLFRYLVSRGFEPDRVFAFLDRRGRRSG